MTVVWALETHAHADHLSGAPYIKAKTGRKDRHRRAHQGRAAHLPAGVQRHRPEDRRQRFRPSVPRWRALQHRRARGRGAAHARAIRRPTSATRSTMRSSSATRCSCRITAPRAPIFRAVTRTSSIARSSGCSRCRRETRLFMCHDYKAPGRDALRLGDHGRRAAARRMSTSADGMTEDEFVAMRTARDATLRLRASSAVDPGEHPRRRVPSGGRQRRALSGDPGDLQEPGRRVRVRAGAAV